MFGWQAVGLRFILQQALSGWFAIFD